MERPNGISLSWLAEFATERGEETFRRMWLLEKRGFYRETNASFQGDAIHLEPYAKHLPRIILYPDGKVVAFGNVDCRINPDGEEFDQDRIRNDDEADVKRFDRWIASVPMPSPWQRTKKFRDDVTAWGCLIIFFGGLYAVVSFLTKVLGDLLGFK